MNFFVSLHAYADWGSLALRLALAATFLAHGRSKWAMWKTQPSAQLPASMLNTLRLLSVCEPLGAAALIVGLLTQLAALGLGLTMVGALNLRIRTMKAPFMGTTTSGWEFELLILAMCVALIFSGAGTFSLDRAWLNL